MNLYTWGPFTRTDMVELVISLDHRIAEAERGSAYANWEVAGRLLLDILNTYPDLQEGSEADDLIKRLETLRNQAAVSARQGSSPA